jgi:DNA adenine methylase
MPNGDRFKTPLRYPGGKAKLANFVKLIFQLNNLLDGHYVEPYAGGAGIALELLFQEYASDIHINDINKSVYAFWHSAINEPAALCELIRRTEVTVEEWERQKAIQANGETASLLDLGFSTFFLNRTNRSGIISGGIIGGKDQSGEWKIDARFNKEELISRIKRVARYRRRIHLYMRDASDFIQNILPDLPPRTLANLDPPYFVKGQRLYDDFYTPDDHAAVAGLVAQITHHWMVSYDKTPEVEQLYKSYRCMSYNLSYSAAERYKGSEIIFFSDSLIIPQVTRPNSISTRMLSGKQEGFQWA